MFYFGMVVMALLVGGGAFAYYKRATIAALLKAEAVKAETAIKDKIKGE